ncbi:MAG: hypothetical protein IIC50_05690 [Planctomycetes bacterium]|nr:hypothetical protein [Planctomycetota bacterium]
MGFLLGDKDVGGKRRGLRSKCLTIEGPEFWGRFELYIDRDEKVALVLPKMDRSIHVLLGTLSEASVHLTFGDSGERTSAVNIGAGGIRWAITPSDIVFSGTQLPDVQASYQGQVLGTARFKGRIEPNWVAQRVKERLGLMDERSAGERGSGQGADAKERLQQFAFLVRRYENHVFGVRLLVVACELKFAHQADILEVMRETYQAVIDREETAISSAKALLQQARLDPHRLADVSRFQFPPVLGASGLDDMTLQAEAYVKVYDRLFAVRHKAFSLPQKDRLRLVRAAQRELSAESQAPVANEVKPKNKRSASSKSKTGKTLDCQV